MRQKQLLFFTLFLCFTQLSHAQSLDPVLVSSAGGHFDGGSASLSWSLGEPVIATEDAGSQQLTQGFHQTNLEITAVSSMGEDYNILVFPNPNTGLLNIDMQSVDRLMYLEVYDALGRLLIYQQAVTNELQELDIAHFSAGHYYLRIYDGASVLKVFKIQKL